MAINLIHSVVFLVVCAVTAALIYLGKSGGVKATVQRLAAVDPINEAIGRATETGRPILFSTGAVTRLRGDLGIQTMAGIDVLSHVARNTARMGTQLFCTVGYAEAYPMHRDTVHSAYIAEGKGDQFDPDTVMYWGEGFSKMWAGIMNLIADERPAAYINIGPVSNDVLQVGHMLGEIDCVAIGGTCRFWGLYTQVMSCDYLVIGEEIFAVAAYLNKNPIEAASLMGQDYSKLFLVALIVINTLAGAAMGGSSLL
jgi:hypothetical protein